MIWSDRFVWVHIGRTGGYSVDRMCRILGRDDIQLDPLGGEWSRWKRHQTIAQREADTGLDLRTGRAALSNFRRLPHWILSFAEYKKKNEGLEFKDEELEQGLLRAEMRDLESGTLDPSRPRVFHADTVLEYYGLGQMDHLLRTEVLGEDFVDVLGRWYPITDTQREQILSVQENGNQYNRDLWSRFSQSQVRQMYASCPAWASLELRTYGDLLA